MIHGAEAAEVLTKLREDYFPTHGLKAAYKALHEAIVSGDGTDPIALNHATKGAVGVPMAIEMMENACSVQRALGYCEIIHDKWAVRELRGLGFNLTNELLDPSESVTMIQKTLITIERPDQQSSESIKMGMQRVIGDIRSRFESDQMSGVPTGYKLLDYASDGWQKQTLNILSGVPGSGKTTMAMAMAMEASKTVPVLFFSMEMGMDQLKAIIDQPEKWSPPGGEWFVDCTGEVDSSYSDQDCREFGVERPTKELAERAAKEARAFNRILAYVHVEAPDWVADWSNENQAKHFVYYNTDGNRWGFSAGWRNKNIEPVMPKHVAKQLCADLNSGRVEL